MGDLTTFEFYVYVPQAATNLITNPSFEVSTDSWVEFNATLTRTMDYQRRGAYSLQVDYASDVEAGVYYAAPLSTGNTYMFSADILGKSGYTYNMYFTDASSALVGTKVTWTDVYEGYWERKVVSYSATATGTFHCRITASTAGTSSTFYIDGCQLESGYETTYLDGDMVGFIPGQADFGWNGTPHASTSWRSAQTTRGGYRERIKDYLPAISALGLGMPPVVNNATPHVLGGSHYQNTIETDRSFTIVGELANTSLDDWLSDRKYLVNAISKHNTAQPQPLVIEWQGLDSDGAVAADTCLIECHYSGGLEGAFEEFGYERIPLQFQAFSPYILSDGDNAASLSYSAEITECNFGAKRVNGVWSRLSTAFTSDNTTGIYAFAKAPDGSIVIGGNFTAVGTADGNNILKYDPATNAITTLSSGCDGAVVAVSIAPNGDIYAGGYFDAAGGIANTKAIAKWNGSVWSALSATADFTSDDIVHTLAISQDGILYIGGVFTDVGDANGDYIVSYTGSSFTSLGTGIDNYVYGLAVAPNGDLYAAGLFKTAGSTACVGIAKWDGSDWYSLSSGLTTSGANYCSACAFDPAGKLYVTGNFVTIGGVAANYIASWNGTAFSALGSGLDFYGKSISIMGNENILVGGNFSAAGGLSLADRFAQWNGSAWTQSGINIPGTDMVNVVFIDGNDIYLGYNDPGTAYASNSTVTVSGSAQTYPVFKITGPGTIDQIVNQTTGKAIYFDALNVNAGETLTLDLNPDNFRFTTNWRGRISGGGTVSNKILPGSDLDFFLQPGDNTITAFLVGSTTTDSGIVMTWKNRYLSLDGAA